MDLAKPARRVSPATADMATESESVRLNEVVPAVPTHAPIVEPAVAVEPAEIIDDPRKYAPTKHLDEEYERTTRISVKTLRGRTGADFESPAAVNRPANKNFLARYLPLVFDERDFVTYGEILRYIVIKDGNCFVYTEETDLSPLYSIPLGNLIPEIEDPNKPHKKSLTISPAANTNISKFSLVSVLLKDSRGKLAYQFTFDISEDKEVAERFLVAVQNVNSISKRKDVVKPSVV